MKKKNNPQVHQNGWVIVSPKGRIMYHTFRARPGACMRTVISIHEQRYGMYLGVSFAKLERAGYKCVLAKMQVGR